MPNNFLLIIIIFLFRLYFFIFLFFLDPFNNCVVRAAEPIESHRDPPEN
jgi:hypothetical protein